MKKFITRHEYDSLVERYPKYMHDVWESFNPQWHLAGCFIEIPQNLVHEFNCGLKTIQKQSKPPQCLK